MNETENRKIAEWVGLCWHEFAPLVDVCVKCTQPANGNPAYFTDPAACLDLLEVLRAKRCKVRISIFAGISVVLHGPNQTIHDTPIAHELADRVDEIPAAVAAAVLKLIDQEKQA